LEVQVCGFYPQIHYEGFYDMLHWVSAKCKANLVSVRTGPKKILNGNGHHLSQTIHHIRNWIRYKVWDPI